MAENTVLNAGAGGDTIATDDIGGVKYPRTKIVIGADNTNDGDVASANPLPVDVISALPAGTNNIGDVDIASAIPAGTNNIGDVDVATVPAPLNVVGGGTEAAALRVTMASDSTGALTVDNAGTFAVQVDSALPAGTNNIGDVDVLSVPAPLNLVGGGTEAAALRVTLANDSTGTLTVDNAGTFAVQVDSALPAGTNNIGDVDILSVPAPLNVTGGGTEATALRVTLANDSTGTSTVDNAGTFAVQVDSALPAGTNNIGDVDIASALPAGANLVGRINIDAQAANGCDFHYSNDLDQTEEQAKATSATLYGGVVINLASSVRYLQIFNATAASVTVGTTPPDMQLPIPTQAATTNGSGFVIPIPACGVNFDTALTVAATTDNEGSGAPGANEVHIILFFK